MNAFNGLTLPERVAVIETEVKDLGIDVRDIKAVQGGQGAAINTICVNVATINSSIAGMAESIKGLSTERAEWKNPLVYLSFVSILVAAIALFK